MSGGGKTGTTTQQLTIPPDVLARYNQVNANAASVAQTPYQAYSSDPSKFVAPINDQQTAGIAGINSGANAAQPAIDSAISGTTGLAAASNPANFASGVSNYMNPFLNNTVQATVDQLNNVNQQQQQQQKGNYISQGAFGGDRAGVGLSSLINQQNLAMGQTVADLENQGFQNAAQNYFTGLNTSAGINQQLAGLGAAKQDAALTGAQAQVGAGTLEQQTQQGGLSALYQQYLQQKAYPFQTAQFQANIAEGTGALSGNTTTTTQPSSFFGNLFNKGGRVERKYGGGLVRYANGGTVEGFDSGGLAGAGDYTSQILASLFGENPNSGAYGAGSGSPGTQGWVPSAQPSSARMMTGNGPAPTQQQSGGLKAADNTLKAGEDIYSDGKKAYDAVDNLIFPGLYHRGGRTGLAAGGQPFDNDNSWVPDNSADNDYQLMKPDDPTGQKKSGGLGGLGDLLKIGADIIPFLARGGRAGFDDGGIADDSDFNDWAYGDVSPGSDFPPKIVPSVVPQNSGFVRPKEVAKPDDDFNDKAFGNVPPGSLVAEANRASGAPTPTAPIAAAPDETAALVNSVGGQPEEPRTFRTGLGQDLMSLMAKGKDAQAFDNLRQKGFTQPVAPAAGLAAATQTPSPAGADSAGPVSSIAATGLGALGDGRQVRVPTGIAAPPTPVAPTAPIVAPAAAIAGPGASAPDASAIFRHNALTHEGLTVNPNDPNGGTLAGFNLGQYQSVNPGIRSFRDVRPADVAAVQNQWFGSVGGNDVAKQFGPKFAAAYADLSMLGQNRAQAALKASGGDPNKFFDIMQASLANTPDKQGAKGAWLQRVQDGRQLAMGNGPVTEAPTQAADNSPVIGAGRGAIGPAGGPQPVSAMASGLGAATVTPASYAAAKPSGGLGQRISDLLEGDTKNEKPGLLLPILKGLGAMASSPSRYLGSAILQGVGAGAGAYTDRQKQMAGINTTNAQTLNNLATALPNSIYHDPGTGISWVPLQGGGWMPMSQFATTPNAKSALGPKVDEQLQSAGLPTSEENLQKPEAPTSQGGVEWTPQDQSFADTANASLKGNPMMIGDAMGQLRAKMPDLNAAAENASRNRPNVDEQASLISASIANHDMGSYQSWFTENVLKPIQTLENKLGVNYTTDQLLNDPAARQDLMHKLTVNQSLLTTPQDHQTDQLFRNVMSANPNMDMSGPAAARVGAFLKVANQRDIDSQNYYPYYASHTQGNLQGAAAAQESHFNYSKEGEAINNMIMHSQNDPRLAQFFSWAAAGKFRNADDVKEAMGRFGLNNILKDNPNLPRYFLRPGVQ